MEMIPVLFINCRSVPYVDRIIDRSKVYETRSRNTLDCLVGKRVLIAETGRGRSVIRCAATVRKVFPVTSRFEFDMFRTYTAVPEGDPYDWTEKTTVKWLYELSDVRPVPVPFHPEGGPRHGRVWMEYTGKRGEYFV